MNQVAASILILSASICGYSYAANPYSSDGTGGLMALIGLGLGLWGMVGLSTSTTTPRDSLYDEADYDDRLTINSSVRNRPSLIPTFRSRPSDDSYDRDYADDFPSGTSRRPAPFQDSQYATSSTAGTRRHNLRRYSSSRVG